MDAIYIGLIICSGEVAEKINTKHGVSLQDVRDAVQWPARPIRAVWLDQETDPRGPRVLVEGIAAGRTIRVILYPVDPVEGTWRLGTAVPVA